MNRWVERLTRRLGEFLDQHEAAEPEECESGGSLPPLTGGFAESAAETQSELREEDACTPIRSPPA